MIKVVVTDSRGRTATKTTTINVLAYSSPVILGIIDLQMHIQWHG